MDSLDVKSGLKKVSEDMVLCCFKINQLLQVEISEELANDGIEEIRVGCKDQDGKMVTRIVSTLLNFFMNSGNKESESNTIIEIIRPFIYNIIISRCKDMKFEWMTYRMCPPSTHGQIMIPDLVIFIDPLSVTNFELLLIEVKKHGNYSNGNLEKDLVKLGKEMQLALNKLITHDVKNPEVLGLLITRYQPLRRI